MTQRQLVISIVVPLLTSALAIGCGNKEQSEGTPAGSSPKGSPSQTGTRVEVAAITASKGSLKIVRPGEIQGAREAVLASAQGGFVERVLVKTGATVKKNQTLAYVDSSTHAAQAKMTKVELDEAKRELARLEGLGKAIASARVDTARSRLARAQAQHSLSAIRQRRAAIRAPFAGDIVGLDIERGEVLAPGTPIGRLVQLNKLVARVAVTDRDVAALSVGTDAFVTTAAVADPVTGKVSRIEQAANLNTRSFMAEVEIENSERRLLPGMIAQVTFSSERGGEAIYLPQDILVTRLEGNGVFLVDDDSAARWRPVELGSIIGTDVEVTKGLSGGERVVILGQRGLADQDKLIITREGVCCTNGRVVFEDPGRKAAAQLQAESKSDEAKMDDDKADDEGASN